MTSAVNDDDWGRKRSPHRQVHPHGKIATIPKSLDRANEGSSTQTFAQALSKPEAPQRFTIIDE
jgi:hypothetical protein